MFRVSKFLPSTCKVVQKMRDTGEDIGLYKLQRRTQSRCADPSGRRQTGIQTQCRTEYFAESTRHTFYYALRFSHLISDTNEETVNTYGVLCWGCKSRSKLIYYSSWITGTVLTSITFVYPVINTIIQLSVCINEGQLMSFRERQRIVYWHIFNVYDLNTVSFMLLWPDWQMVKMVLSNILYFYRLKQINWT